MLRYGSLVRLYETSLSICNKINDILYQDITLSGYCILIAGYRIIIYIFVIYMPVYGIIMYFQKIIVYCHNKYYNNGHNGNIHVFSLLYFYVLYCGIIISDEILLFQDFALRYLDVA